MMAGLCSYILSFAGSEYQIIIDHEKLTCHNSNSIGTQTSGQSEGDCRRRCDNHQKCKFFFYTLNNWCILYNYCDSHHRRAPKYRETKEVGATFAKQGPKNIRSYAVPVVKGSFTPGPSYIGTF